MTGLGRARMDRALPRELRDEHGAVVADDLRFDVLERARVGGDAGDVHAALVGERVAPDVGLIVVRREVQELVEEVRGRGQRVQLLGAHALVAELELQVGDQGRQVGVAAALAVAVLGALDLGRAGHDPRQACWRRRSRRRRGSGFRSSRRCRPSSPTTASIASRDPVRQRAAVGVAAGDRLRAGLGGRAQARQRSTRGRRRSRRRSARRRRSTRLPAPTRNAIDSAIIRRFSARSTLTTFSRCRLQVLPTSVQTGAKQSARTCSAGSSCGAHVAPAGHPEGRDLGVLEALAGQQLEELELLGVGAREAGLDQVDRRARRACARPAPSRAPTATCPPPACHRAGWCRRARSWSCQVVAAGTSTWSSHSA